MHWPQLRETLHRTIYPPDFIISNEDGARSAGRKVAVSGSSVMLHSRLCNVHTSDEISILPLRSQILYSSKSWTQLDDQVHINTAKPQQVSDTLKLFLSLLSKDPSDNLLPLISNQLFIFLFRSWFDITSFPSSLPSVRLCHFAEEIVTRFALWNALYARKMNLKGAMSSLQLE